MGVFIQIACTFFIFSCRNCKGNLLGVFLAQSFFSLHRYAKTPHRQDSRFNQFNFRIISPARRHYLSVSSVFLLFKTSPKPNLCLTRFNRLKTLTLIRHHIHWVSPKVLYFWILLLTYTVGIIRFPVSFIVWCWLKLLFKNGEHKVACAPMLRTHFVNRELTFNQVLVFQQQSSTLLLRLRFIELGVAPLERNVREGMNRFVISNLEILIHYYNRSIISERYH
jgi:hypothetical protein